MPGSFILILLISYKAHCNKKCVNGELPSIYFPKIIKQVNQHPLSYVPLGRKTFPCFEHCTFRIPYRGSPTTKSLLGALQIFAGCTHPPPELKPLPTTLKYAYLEDKEKRKISSDHLCLPYCCARGEVVASAQEAQESHWMQFSINPWH